MRAKARRTDIGPRAQRARRADIGPGAQRARRADMGPGAQRARCDDIGGRMPAFSITGRDCRYTARGYFGKMRACA